jgi:GNAT superfamily N-acetyltransferase
MTVHFVTALESIKDFWLLFQTTGWNAEYKVSQEDLAVVVRNSQHVLAAYVDDRMVGFGRIVTDGILHAMIYDLITDPEYQGTGVGTEVLKRLVEWCRNTGIRDIQLFCARGKRGFYEKRGFVARGEDRPGMVYNSAHQKQP